MSETLNDYFPNPFEYLDYDIKAPFEEIENQNDIKKLKTNVVVDYYLFSERVRFHPFLQLEEMVRNKVKILYLTMFTNLSQFELTFNRSKEFESKGSYNVKKYFPYLNFELKLIPREDFEDPAIRDKYKELHTVLPQTKYVVNVVYPTIVKFQIKFSFSKQDANEVHIFKTGLQKISNYYGELLGNPELYPCFEKKDNLLQLNYPSVEKSYLVKEVIEDLQ